MIHRGIIVLGICLSLITPVFADEFEEVDVPITRIVLFSSGVGYFERSADIFGPSEATLNFKADQINDVLKSMIVMDSADDAMVTVNYATLEPTAYALQSFAIDLSGEPTLSELLSQLRGAEISIDTPEFVEGKILGVEEKVEMVVTGGETVILENHILNLVTDEGIQAIHMDDVQNVEFLDDELNKELNKALDVLLSSRDTTRKPVTVKFEGSGTRPVRMGYLNQTPVWKTSYRLDFSGEESRLQGWAIVENTSDTDWEDVSFSLVSGQPISFVQDLYTPLYASRPVIQPELMENLYPQTYDTGVGLTPEQIAAGWSEQTRGSSAWTVKGGTGVQEFAAPRLNLSLSGSGSVGGDMFTDEGGEDYYFDVAEMQMAGETGAVGELFRFDLAKPVTLERKTSAMLPLVDRTISAEKVGIYNIEVMEDHPLNGAYLTNDTGLKLLGGPITVFDGDMYAGDAMIKHFSENEKRLISYAVDLDVNVVVDGEHEREVTGIKIVKGAMVMTHKTVATETFDFKNNATKDKVLIVEYPRSESWKLVTPTEVEETTDDLYRFRLELGAEATERFEVSVQKIHDQAIGIMNCSTVTLMKYSERGELSPGAKEAILGIIVKRQALGTLKQELNDMVAEQAQITAAKAEVRKDLASVTPDSQLGQRCMTKLSEYMDRLDQLETDIRAKRDEVAIADKSLVDHVNELSVD